MACVKLYSMSFALVVVVVVVLAARPVAGASAHLHFYMHDVPPTSVQVVHGPRGYFGNTFVIDDVLTEGPTSSSVTVGRAQGMYICASVANLELLVTVNVVLTSGPYAGSSVTVVGRDDLGAPVRELSVVGGTGQFRMARGYVLWKAIRSDLIELDVFAEA